MIGWNRVRSQERIQNLMASVPSTSVMVRDFDSRELERRRAVIKASRARFPDRSEDLIFEVSPSEAVLVDGVHVYLQLLDYAPILHDQSKETAAWHERVLQMLHVHYAACDSVAEEFEAQRVDYHGPRMHSVILTPTGPDAERDRVLRALEYADALARTVEGVGLRVGEGAYATKVRIGVDTGLAVAVNSGRGSEPEPLFLGQPANYAAKLAEGDEPGIYPSTRVRHVLRQPIQTPGLLFERASPISLQDTQRSFPTYQVIADADLVERAILRVQDRYRVETVPSFKFHYRRPPLSTLKFSELSPSNSVRMESTTLFADLDGFTKYVDNNIATGTVSEMVANLHVLRGELAGCSRDDFGGRKVRFIGDCLHAVVAEGDAHNVNRLESVYTAVGAAAGLRSSFELCQETLPGLEELGIAIGVEFGTTPLSRIGIRGERSVRVCVGKAAVDAEALQRTSSGDETRLGPRALSYAPSSLNHLFTAGVVSGLDYASFVSHVSEPAKVSSGNVVREVRPYFE